MDCVSHKQIKQQQCHLWNKDSCVSITSSGIERLCEAKIYGMWAKITPQACSSSISSLDFPSEEWLLSLLIKLLEFL